MNTLFLPALWSSLLLLQNPLPLLLPQEMTPGDTAEVLFWFPEDQAQDKWVELRDLSGTLQASARFFPLPGSWNLPGLQLAVLGLGADNVSGPMELLLKEPGGGGRVLGSVEVFPRKFKETTLRVTPSMRAVQTTPDPRRQEQSRRLNQVLENFDPRALVVTGRFSNPLQASYRPTSQYGDRRKEVYPRGGSSLTIHQGTDMAAAIGTPVFAPASGRAVLVEDRILTGWTLVLEHAPGIYSMMYHLDSISAVVGRLYRAGDPVATLGTTGFSTGPHLHWEVRVNLRAVDPLKLLERPLIDKDRIFSILHRAFLQKRG